MGISKLSEIVRQKDPALKEAVEKLACGDVHRGIASLDQRGRVHEIVNSQERFGAIAREYSQNPEGTLVISPDNESRRELNWLIHREMQHRGDVSKEEHKLRVLESRQDLTGADREWAGQYEVGDVLRYSRGSKTVAIAAGEYARVTGVDPKENLITIERENGSLQTYDPRRLSGVSVHRETQHEFAKGDRVQFTAPSRALHIANRDLGTVEHVNSDGDFRIRMDSGREIRFNILEHPHLDHGYAVTSHSSQGQTAQRVLIHVDTEKSELLVNNRFAYVSVSRAQHEAHIYTNNGSKLSSSLSRELTQQTATVVEQEPPAPKVESVALRGLRPAEEEQGQSLGIGAICH